MNKAKNVYETAIGLEDGDGNLLKPSRAIYSSITNILSNYSSKQQEEILGSEIYAESKILMHLVNKKEFKEFIDIAPKTISIPFHKEKLVHVPNEAFENESTLCYKPVYSLESILNSLNNLDEDSQTERIRLVAMKLSEDYFPATEEFKEQHYAKMDKKMGFGHSQ